MMGKRRGVLRKLVAFMCAFRHGKSRSNSGFSVSSVVLACDVRASSEEEMLGSEAAVAITGTATAR